MDDQLRKFQQHLKSMLNDFQTYCIENHLEVFLVGGSALGAYRHHDIIPWDDDIDVAMPRKDFEKMESLLKQVNNRIGNLTYAPAEHGLIPEAPVGHLYDLEAVEDIHNSPKIDIHPIDGVPEGKLQRKFQNMTALIYYLGVYHLPTKNKGKFFHTVTKVLLWVIPDSLWKIIMKHCKRYFTKWDLEESENICSLFGVAGYGREVMPKEWVFPLVDIQYGEQEFKVPCNKEAYLTRLYGDWKTLPPKAEQKPVHDTYMHFREEI